MSSAILHRVFRQIGKERGKNNEDRFFEVFKQGRVPQNFPSWFCGIERSTKTQDYSRRIDAVVFTKDVGKIFLQLKSSRIGVKKFEEQQKKSPKSEWIFPLIIKITDSDAEIEIKTRTVLSQARQVILNHRNRSD